MKKNNKKVLFYAGGSYGFRSMPIWFVYEICQVYPTILLSEKLDPETERILNNKEFFPKLEEIVPIQCLSNSLKLMIKNNKALYKRAEDVIRRYKPDIVVTSGSYQYPFPLYLRRMAKRAGAINICPLGPKYFKEKDSALWSKLTSVYLKKSHFFPFCVKLLLAGLRSQIGHLLYYWILPLTVGEMPYRKEASCTLYTKNWGRSADYYISFSKKDYNSHLREGVPAEKLYILSSLHPRGYEEIRESFKKSFILSKANKFKDGRKILTWMYPNLEIGIKKSNLKLIPEKEMKKGRIKIITLIAKMLKGWKIFIKPYPLTKAKEFSEIKKTYGSISSDIEFVDPSEWADAYTEISDVILGSSPSSFTLYTASLICPEKPILSLDLENELLGDCFKDFNGIEYIDTEERFINILKLIRDNKYRKDYQRPEKEQLGEKEFSSFVELLEYLFNKKITPYG